MTLINTSTGRLDEIEQILQTYHNNFGRIATEFESINGGISTLKNEMNRYYAVVQARSDISPEIRIEPIEEADQSEVSSGSIQRSFSNISSEILFLLMFGKNVKKILAVILYNYPDHEQTKCSELLGREGGMICVML